MYDQSQPFDHSLHLLFWFSFSLSSTFKFFDTSNALHFSIINFSFKYLPDMKIYSNSFTELLVEK